MKAFLCLSLACLYLVFPLKTSADDFLPSASRFPLDRLEEMRRALDAARGDAAAVEAWLAKGGNLDARGKTDLAYSIVKEDLPDVYRALTDRAAPEWIDGIWSSRGVDLFVLVYKGLSLERVLAALGQEDLYSVGFSRYFGAKEYTIHFPNDLDVRVGEEVLTLLSRYGSFEFERKLKAENEWPLDGSEPLIGWSVKGYPVKVSVHEDDQLSLVAFASDPDSGPLVLIVRGIPYFNPLYCAAAYGRVDVIRALASQGASLAPQVPGGKTALHVAAERNQLEALDALLSAGMAIDAQTDEGATPLMAAVEGPEDRNAPSGSRSEKAREKTALHLLSRGADPSVERRNGETVLFSASARDMPSLLDRLLELRVDAEIRNDAGETAVFAAIRADQPRALDALLRHGASWRRKNTDGKTPKDIAKKTRSRDCLGVLEYQEPLHWSALANINLSKAAEDGYGWAPGLGASFDLHVRLSRSLLLTTELEYVIRGTEADPGDPWLVSAEGSPYYEYEHIGAACLLDFALVRNWAWRLSGVAGAGFRFQTSAFIRTDSGAWEPVDICDQLDSSGPCAIAGLGLNGFMPRGVLTGVELRYSRSLGGRWTSRGGGLDSLSLLIRIGS